MSNLVERWKKQLSCYRAGFRSSINEQIIIDTIEALKPVEDTLGGNQRLDAADHIEALQAKVEVISGLLHAAKCPTCEGIGAYYDNMGEVH